MAYSWAQGYLSGANISLVEADAKHVDMGQLDEAKVINMLLAYCKANPDKQPLGALNDYLRKSPKVKMFAYQGSSWRAGPASTFPSHSTSAVRPGGRMTNRCATK